jgi:hypothetical protein
LPLRCHQGSRARNSKAGSREARFIWSHYQDALAAYSNAYQLHTGNREVRRKIAVVLTLPGRPEEAQKYR